MVYIPGSNLRIGDFLTAEVSPVAGDAFLQSGLDTLINNRNLRNQNAEDKRRWDIRLDRADAETARTERDAKIGALGALSSAARSGQYGAVPGLEQKARALGATDSEIQTAMGGRRTHAPQQPKPPELQSFGEPGPDSPLPMDWADTSKYPMHPEQAAPSEWGSEGWQTGVDSALGAYDAAGTQPQGYERTAPKRPPAMPKPLQGITAAPAAPPATRAELDTLMMRSMPADALLQSPPTAQQPAAQATQYGPEGQHVYESVARLKGGAGLGIPDDVLEAAASYGASVTTGLEQDGGGWGAQLSSSERINKGFAAANQYLKMWNDKLDADAAARMAGLRSQSLGFSQGLQEQRFSADQEEKWQRWAFNIGKNAFANVNGKKLMEQKYQLDQALGTFENPETAGYGNLIMQKAFMAPGAITQGERDMFNDVGMSIERRAEGWFVTGITGVMTPERVARIKEIADLMRQKNEAWFEQSVRRNIEDSIRSLKVPESEIPRLTEFALRTASVGGGEGTDTPYDPREGDELGQYQ